MLCLVGCNSAPPRTPAYPHYSTLLNFDGIQFPVSVKDFPKFEQLNNISINVFVVEGKCIFGPLHFTSQKRVRHVNLLYILKGNKSNYCWIKNLSRLVGQQLSTNHMHKHACDVCLLIFRSEEQLQKHQEHDCNHITTAMPNSKDNILEFMIYDYFEGILKSVVTKNVRLADGDEEDVGCEDDDEKQDSRCIQLRFINSLRCMASSLEKLVKNFDSDQFVKTRRRFSIEKGFGLVTKKGNFPYNYVTSAEVPMETSLPAKEAFHNNLTSSDTSFADYGHAQKVWKQFSIRTLGGYNDLYLKTDVLLLADVFENFRNVCIKTYYLDPCQYLTTPSLSWDAMLKYTEVKLEVLTDIEMHHFVRKGIRGGLVQCSVRYARANNKYMEDFEPEEPSKFLTYLDANNLYGWAMCQHLSINNFKWLDEDKLQQLRSEILNIPSTCDEGFILEVDLQYPKYLHNEHNDLAFCPEYMRSPYPNSETPKLIASLQNKAKYIMHYLLQCLRNGLKLTQIHRILSFNQSPWLKTYIDLNTSVRTKIDDD